jgi:hypothetical protein
VSGQGSSILTINAVERVLQHVGLPFALALMRVFRGYSRSVSDTNWQDMASELLNKETNIVFETWEETINKINDAIQFCF